MQPDRLSRHDIESTAEEVLGWFNPRLLHKPQAIPVGQIVARLEEKAKLVACLSANLGLTRNKRRILGAFLFDPIPTIFVDASLKASGPRFRFTLAHELGHFALHRRLRMDCDEIDKPAIEDAQRHLHFGRRTKRTHRDWLEWQANMFAGALLLPRTALWKAIVEKQMELGVTRRLGSIFVDAQPHNLQDYRILVAHLHQLFDVSRTTLVIRLRDLKLVRDERPPVSSHVARRLRALLHEEGESVDVRSNLPVSTP